MKNVPLKIFNLLVLPGILFWINACSGEPEEEFLTLGIQDGRYRAENVVIVVIDGPRFSDTWGHAEKKHIPRMANELAPQGVFFDNFRNEGATRTLSGHTAILTGKYQAMANDGSEFPQTPSLFQHYLQQTAQSPDNAVIVTSKLKLKVLADTRKLEWRGRYNPSTNCGKGNSNRPDRETLQQAIRALREKQPRLMLVQFLGPDANAHLNNREGYLRSLEETDSLVVDLWQFIQQDGLYKDNTALFITNDHGRHADDHKDGFISHGDNCDECRHISLLVLGPDFAQGKVVKEQFGLIDIAPTIGQIMGIHLPAADGNPIYPLLGQDL